MDFLSSGGGPLYRERRSFFTVEDLAHLFLAYVQRRTRSFWSLSRHPAPLAMFTESFSRWIDDLLGLLSCA